MRDEIEAMLERDYRMKKLRDWEYELAIEYDASYPESLDKTIYELLGEMSREAELSNCFIETDVVERGTDRHW